MSFAASFRTEVIKIKRSASVWLCVLGSGFIPFIFFLTYILKPASNIKKLHINPWEQHIGQGWQAFAAFLLPMFIILICSLVVQIEYKNNTWKQVYASPQSYANIFFSKFLAIQLMILLLFALFNLFLLLAAVVPNLFYSKYTFLSSTFKYKEFLLLNMRTYISILAISSLQYWLSLRFKNFIVPVGIGLALLITSLITFTWEHIAKVPYAYPMLTMTGRSTNGKFFLLNHELNSIGYLIFFTTLAFLDMKYRKERG